MTFRFGPQHALINRVGRPPPSRAGEDGTEERVLTSVANFFVGEVLHLRPEDGGGAWEVVELLPREDGFAKSRARRVRGKRP